MQIFLVSFILFILTVVFTGVVKYFAISKNVIDKPNERSSHTVPTPRGGGLSIVVVWIFALIYLKISNQIENDLFYAFLSGIVLAVVSLIDDIVQLNAKSRFIAQSISAFGALYFLGGIQLYPDLTNPILFWGINIVAFIGIVWFINLFNFLDGIDAYASNEAILVSLGMLLITANTSLFFLIAIVLGFLMWNWPKAKIFMGDVGSTQLGFIIVVFAIYFHNNQDLTIYNWLILTSVFWLDATLTLFRRWRNKEALNEAHKKHTYQRLHQSGFSHLKVNLFVLIINICLIAIVFINIRYFNYDISVLIGVVAILYLLVLKVDKLFPFKK